MLNILVISDIHGNTKSLDNFLKFTKQMDLILCLGDIDSFGKIDEEGYNFLEMLASKPYSFFIPGNCDPLDFLKWLNNHENQSLHQKQCQINSYIISGFGGGLREPYLFTRVRNYYKKAKELTNFQKNLNSGILHLLDVDIEDNHFVVNPETKELNNKWEAMESPTTFDEEAINSFFMSIIGENTKQIWVVHYPPFGFPGTERPLGISLGSIGLSDAINSVQPRLVLCGHLHRAQKWQMKNTLCLSVPAFKDNLVTHIQISDNNEVRFKHYNVNLNEEISFDF